MPRDQMVFCVVMSAKLQNFFIFCPRSGHRRPPLNCEACYPGLATDVKDPN
jgi:hypothetical protein